MVWEGDVDNVPGERDDWVPDAQRWISQINGVLQCKIDLDPAGEVTGVHVVAGMDREPRHIVRDVEGLLKARLGLDVYYKKIGVVQVVDAGTAGGPATESLAGGVSFHAPGTIADEASPAARGDRPSASRGEPRPSPPPAAEPPESPDSLPDDPIPAVLVAEGLGPRLQCTGVGVISSELTVRAEVVLRAGTREARGAHEGANTEGSDVRQVARAALEAVGGLLAAPPTLGLREVRIDTIGAGRVVVAAVDVVESRRSETLVGTCPTGHNLSQAIVYAVLDALNRRLALFEIGGEA